MNQIITETEELLKGIDMSIEDIYDIMRKGVANRYRMVSQLWGYETVDDMVNSLWLYYLSPMKSTGEIRLHYYIKKYNDKKHIENQIRLSAYQAPLVTARRNEVKNKPISYEQDINNDSDGSKITLVETLEDNYIKVQFENNLMLEDIINTLTETLNQMNLDYLKQHSRKSSLEFLIDMNNYLLAYKQTSIQLNLLRDLYNGYKRNELTNKYTNYNRQLNMIKNALSTLYPEYNSMNLNKSA